jgi:hypothetical protein
LAVAATVVVFVLAEALGATNGLIAVTTMAMLIPVRSSSLVTPNGSVRFLTRGGISTCGPDSSPSSVFVVPSVGAATWKPPIPLIPIDMATELNS